MIWGQAMQNSAILKACYPVYVTQTYSNLVITNVDVAFLVMVNFMQRINKVRRICDQEGIVSWSDPSLSDLL